MTVSEFESRLEEAPALFVHIGAGEGESASLARSAGRAILVEPDPDRFTVLKQRLGDAPSVDLLHAALSSRSGVAPFHRYSLARFGGLSKATGARRLFRGLQHSGETEIRTIQLAEIIGKTDSGSIAVLIDAASEAANALDQLHELGLLHEIDALAVKVAEIALHEGGATRDDLERWAQEHGMQLRRMKGEDDPDIYVAWVEPAATSQTLNTQENQNETMQSELAEAVSKLEAELAQRDQAIEEADKRHTEETEALKDKLAMVQERQSILSGQVTSLQSQLVKENQARRQAESEAAAAADQLSAMKKEDTAYRERQTNEKARMRAELDEQKAACSQAKSELDQSLEKIRAQKSEIDALENNLQVARTNQKDAQTQIDEMKSARIVAEKMVAQKDQEIAAHKKTMEEAREDLSLSLRTQRIAQADLHDLQARYDKVSAKNDSLEALLVKLMNRLYGAADQMKALSWAEADTDRVEKADDGSTPSTSTL